ncbi:MAG: ATP-binding cassette domain-containing protein [Bacilli bacterium]
MKNKICQSCGMPLTSNEQLGTNKDGSINNDYCKYCYINGEFIDNVTMEEYIEMCSLYGFQAGMTNKEMKEHCMKLFPTLKRWEKKEIIMEKCIIEIQNLTKYYGKIKGVEDLSLKLYEGEIFGFIGPNGAGKSTTIRSIMNLINKTSGKVLIEGKEFNKDDIKIKETIGYLPSEIHLYDDFTVKEMLDYHESFYKKDIHKRRIELVKRFKLDENKKIEDLSLGNLKKLGIILAFVHEPKILILDEPTSGLDPIMQNVFYGLLKEEKLKGNTIFYSTHILSEVSKICDRVGIIKDGKLIKVESMEDLTKKNLTFVTLSSNDIKNIKEDLRVKITFEGKNTIKFKNNLTYDELIKKISKYKIDKILIEEFTLEEMFLHYYK